MAHLPPVSTDTCQSWYSEVGIDIDFDVHKCFGYEDGSQERFIVCHSFIDDIKLVPVIFEKFIGNATSMKK